MALSTFQDIGILSGWGILKAYYLNRAVFLGVGKAVYQTFSSLGVPPHGPSDIETSLSMGIQATAVFQSICQSKAFAKQSLYPLFARALARYILDNEWDEISKV